MRVLHINAYDTKGGASIAAFRLNEALNISGVDSQMLVHHKLSNSSDIIADNSFFNSMSVNLFSFLDSLPARIFKKNINNFSPSWVGSHSLIRTINSLNPDLVHLHWVCNGMLAIKDLPRIKPPIMWTLHDNWAFSGACHNLHLCPNHNAQTHQCGSLSDRYYQNKQQAYEDKKDLAIITPSKWLFDLSRSSTLLKSKKHFHLPNTIDTNIFTPINQQKARNVFKLPQEKKIILCGALNILSDPNKGLSLAINAFEQLNDSNTILVVFGNDSLVEGEEYGNRVHFIGKIDDEAVLNSLYSAADAVIVPSLQENFSNTILESLACGKPVIAFDVGGNSDLIMHAHNGYLAKPYLVSDLRDGIKAVLSNNNFFKSNARLSAENKYDFRVIAESHKKLYSKFLKTTDQAQVLNKLRK